MLEEALRVVLVTQPYKLPSIVAGGGLVGIKLKGGKVVGGKSCMDVRSAGLLRFHSLPQ